VKCKIIIQLNPQDYKDSRFCYSTTTFYYFLYLHYGPRQSCVDNRLYL